jgi:hypothetical protein
VSGLAWRKSKKQEKAQQQGQKQANTLKTPKHEAR